VNVVAYDPRALWRQAADELAVEPNLTAALALQPEDGTAEGRLAATLTRRPGRGSARGHRPAAAALRSASAQITSGPVDPLSGVCFYLFVIHTATAGERSFINRDLLRSPNFMAGTVLMFFIGGILSGTLALLPTMLQSLMNYPS